MFDVLLAFWLLDYVKRLDCQAKKPPISRSEIGGNWFTLLIYFFRNLFCESVELWTPLDFSCNSSQFSLAHFSGSALTFTYCQFLHTLFF